MSAASDAALAALVAHWQTLRPRSLMSLFAEDPRRFEHCSARLDDLLLDYSKCALTSVTMRLLEQLVEAADVAGRRDAMFAGLRVNFSENRAALHVALRNRTGRPILLDGRDVMPEIGTELARALAFAEGVRTGEIVAADGRPFTDVVNLGIGGSDLGPAMATAALAPYHSGPRVRFVSNIDGAHLADTIAVLEPQRTLFIVSSKTFTTLETLTNAASARRWVAERLGADAVSAHFAASTAAPDKAGAFGIPSARTFRVWDWVGGRYSVWSAVGLPLMIAIGAEQFSAFLDGAQVMDEHFRTARFSANLPMLLGAIGVWHRAVCGYGARAILPYDQRLARFPAHLQQLEMESNGKSVTQHGEPLNRPSCPVIFGEPGTNAQHAFFQLLHQGTDVIPCEFLVAAKGHEQGETYAEHHRMLVANCLAQSEALLAGRTREQAKAQLLAEGRSEEEAERLAPHRTLPGNRPSITIAYQRLDPFTLGRLIALYEHRVLVEAAILGINPFDQWGVEFGKELAGRLVSSLSGVATAAGNASTQGLLDYLMSLAGRP
ncbi:MAG TPA: glucose-6-phosphate isomerase [Hyphomicrobiaceae bacterium]|nr:glucose-6-phosphate isomerase [Hyphomicrobiaceae bacterium]